MSDWWRESLVGVEGEDHQRIRKLVNPAFSKSVIAQMTDSFRDLAHDVIDRFADAGECEFMSDFAEPFSSRALARLLGLAEDDWQELSELSGVLGLAFGPTVRKDLARIESALLALYARADRLVAQARSHPSDDFVTLLTNAGRRRRSTI